MMESSAAERMEAELAQERPSEALVALAIALRDEGSSQRALYDLFASCMARHRDDPDETRWDALADVADCIVGWCSPQAQLFDADLKA